MENIYFYTVGSDSYDGTSLTVLFTDKFYSEEEFKNLCAEITAEIYRNRREIFADSYKRFDKYNEELKIKYSDKQMIEALEMHPFHSFYEMEDKVIEKLIKEYNFKKLEYTANFCPDGILNFTDEEDKGHCNSDTNCIKEKILS